MIGRSTTDRQAGITFIEVIVTVAILGIVGAVAASGLISGYRSTDFVNDQTHTTAALKVAAERMGREIRAADPIEGNATAGERRLQVRIYRNGVCTRYIYRIEGGNLVQYTQGPLTPAPAPLGSSTIPNACTSPAASEPPPAALPRTVLVEGASPTAVMFRYFDAAGTEVPPPTNVASAEKVTRVRVTLTRPQTGRKKDLVVSTVVDLRNAERTKA
ncbi:MAG: prepilin-type N-terminal cleavage/methylation domain-containing protein [Actinobacteria bacterium]|nr:prepilin-type N-terminal cleavage/methylation domain-containing protein [Actinomycetota bacterium]